MKKIKVYSIVFAKRKILTNQFIFAVRKIMFPKMYLSLIFMLQFLMTNKFNQPANFKANAQPVNLELLDLVNMKKGVI